MSPWVLWRKGRTKNVLIHTHIHNIYTETLPWDIHKKHWKITYVSDNSERTANNQIGEGGWFGSLPFWDYERAWLYGSSFSRHPGHENIKWSIGHLDYGFILPHPPPHGWRLQAPPLTPVDAISIHLPANCTLSPAWLVHVLCPWKQTQIC